MSVISKFLKGIRLDSHTLPNLLKNVSPALALTPLGLAGTAAASFAGDLGRGKNVGEAAVGAGKNALTGAGVRAGVGALRGALQKGASSALPSTTYTQGLDGTFANAANGARVGTEAAAPLTHAGNFIDKASDFGGGALKAAIHNPTATAMGLNAASNLATAGTQNRAASAQADLLEGQREENAYELARRKQRDLELDPAFMGLGTALGQSLARPTATNPYLAGA